MVPWFNYFQMKKQLEECDKLLLEKAKRLINYKGYKEFDLEELWDSTGKSESQLNERKESFGKIVELFQLSCIYNIEKTRERMTLFMKVSTTCGSNFLEMQDLFDIPVINTLVELALPLEKGDIYYENTYEDVQNEKPVFSFDHECACRDELQKLSLDEINNNKGMLVWIVSSHMERRAKQLLREENKSLKKQEEERRIASP